MYGCIDVYFIIRKSHISNKYYIKKFEEFHKQINKLVIAPRELRDKILYNRKKKQQSMDF